MPDPHRGNPAAPNVIGPNDVIRPPCALWQGQEQRGHSSNLISASQQVLVETNY
jgi:hypothetical protein